MEKEIIEYICENCGNTKSYINKTKRSEAGECTRCHKMTFYRRIDGSIYNTSPDSMHMVHCPYCNSIDVKKISTTSKVASAALWGVFAAGKVSKQWHCNNCKSDF